MYLATRRTPANTKEDIKNDPDAAHRMSDPTTDYRSIEMQCQSFSHNAFECRVAGTIDTCVYPAKSLYISFSFKLLDKKRNIVLKLQCLVTEKHGVVALVGVDQYWLTFLYRVTVLIIAALSMSCLKLTWLFYSILSIY